MNSMASPYNSHGNLVLFFSSLCLCLLVKNAASAWINHGGDIANRRYADGELLINPLTVNRLQLKWKFYAGRDISATPAIVDGVVYFPSWNGFLYAVNAFNGNLIWKQNLGQLTGLSATGAITNVNASVSRATPTIVGNRLIVGIYGPAVVIAVTRSTGQLLWMTKVDLHPLAIITTSGTPLLGNVYVGVSSLEEALPAAQCCTFRGSLVKLDVRTGAIVWQTYMLPDNGGRLGEYSGAAIWGSSPAIDIFRGLVYIATGNLYTAPPEVTECQEQQNNQTAPPTGPDQCTGPDIHFDSVLALDIYNGNIRWFRQLGGADVFYLGCVVPGNPCPPGPNPDADFAEAPMLLTITSNGRRRDIAVAAQKSGFVWALDRDNGDIAWVKQAGPGGLEGGAMWGAATDGKRIYTNIANSGRIRFPLTPLTQTTTAGVWVALDANTGQILWTTANPSNETTQAPVSLTKDVLFAGSVASNGPLYAMDAGTGAILWSYNTSATIYGGASASYGCIYLGNGYAVGLAALFHPTWTAGTSLYAFCIE